MFAIVAIVKAIFVLGDRNVWMKFLYVLYTKHAMFSVLFLIFAGIIFYYLLQELSIVQILAAGAFTSCLIAIAFLQYARGAQSFVKKRVATLLKGMLWIYLIIWFALVAWVLWNIFA